MFHFLKLPSAAAIAVAIALVGCSKPVDTPEMSAAAFFAQLASGDTRGAYVGSSFAFQAQQSEKAFEVRVQELKLGSAKVTTKQRETDEKTAKLDVQVTPKSGDPYPLILNMQLDGKHWRVFSLRSPRNSTTGLSENTFGIFGKPASFNEGVAQKLPEDMVVRQLVADSMALFAKAIESRSFTDFYNSTAAAWQVQLTETQLQRAFQAFIDKQVNLNGIADVRPVFAPAPMVSSEGLLLVQGYYPTEPYEVHFTLKYIYELPEWKIFGLDLVLKKADPKNKNTPSR